MVKHTKRNTNSSQQHNWNSLQETERPMDIGRGNRPQVKKKKQQNNITIFISVGLLGDSFKPACPRLSHCFVSVCANSLDIRGPWAEENLKSSVCRLLSTRAMIYSFIGQMNYPSSTVSHASSTYIAVQQQQMEAHSSTGLRVSSVA